MDEQSRVLAEEAPEEPSLRPSSEEAEALAAMEAECVLRAEEAVDREVPPRGGTVWYIERQRSLLIRALSIRAFL